MTKLDYSQVADRLLNTIEGLRAEHQACTARGLSNVTRINFSTLQNLLVRMRKEGLVTWTDMPGSLRTLREVPALGGSDLPSEAEWAAFAEEAGDAVFVGAAAPPAVVVEGFSQAPPTVAAAAAPVARRGGMVSTHVSTATRGDDDTCMCACHRLPEGVSFHHFHPCCDDVNTPVIGVVDASKIVVGVDPAEGGAVVVAEQTEDGTVNVVAVSELPVVQPLNPTTPPPRGVKPATEKQLAARRKMQEGAQRRREEQAAARGEARAS